MKGRSRSFICGFLATSVPAWMLAVTLHSHRLPNSQSLAAPPRRLPVGGSEDRPDVALRRFYTDSNSTAEIRIRAASALSMLRLDELSDACEQALSLPLVKREAVLKSLLCRWAEEDGPAAMLWGRDHLRGKKEWMQCFLNLGAVWASCDPQGLVAWFTAHRRENDWAPVGHGFSSTVLDWLAPADVVAAARLACDEVGHTADYISNTLRFHIRTKEDVEGIAALLKDRTWPSLELRETAGYVYLSSGGGAGFEVAQVVRALESRWPEIDPQGWAAWQEQHPTAIDGNPQPLVSAMNAFTAAPSAVGATAVVEAAPPDLLAGTIARIIDRWARLDPDAAGFWLGEQGFTDTTAPAIESFARAAGEIDPPSAFAWIERVQDTALRERMILKQFDSWHESDPAAATSFLDSNQWPERRLQNIRRMAASRPPRRG